MNDVVINHQQQTAVKLGFVPEWLIALVRRVGKQTLSGKLEIEFRDGIPLEGQAFFRGNAKNKIGRAHV